MRTLTPASALASPPCPQLASHLTSSPHTSPARLTPHQVEQRRLKALRAEEDAKQAAAEAIQQEQYRKQQERSI